MKKTSLYLALALALSVFSYCRNSSRDTETAKESNEQKEVMNEAQADFLVEVAAAGMLELEFSKVALAQASSLRVKNFAKMMVKDHEELNREVKTLADRKNITLPAAMDAAQQSTLDELRRKTGRDFDRRYMERMEEEHERDIRKFEDASENNKDSEVQVFAAKTLPKLRAHLDSARMIRNAMK